MVKGPQEAPPLRHLVGAKLQFSRVMAAFPEPVLSQFLRQQGEGQRVSV